MKETQRKGKEEESGFGGLVFLVNSECSEPEQGTRAISQLTFAKTGHEKFKCMMAATERRCSLITVKT